MPLQYINGADGKPAFVVIPYDEFSHCDTTVVATSEASTSDSLLSADGLFIRLPHGGPGAQIDLRQFIDAWVRRGTIWVMAVNKRRQAYDKFLGDGRNGLDAILRRCFLPKDSPYKNTMQATTAVVDALGETGVFSRSIEPIPGYYRPVQAIRINDEKAMEFLQKHGKPENPLYIHEFVLP
ncbi:hypothetical protein [Burkholderia ubonensis]|uniref:Uncharacterized protein n=1 Tax=Burkholderia ubonensis TaxID=101571 RepID=A0AB74DDJ8_9BURK|nr:hypothetical protein [Burkholderia ubonensis]PAJ82857.1 hypothetical protein CJO71_03265 [Burkholderia ubonensis]PAJ84637.1 hypothetical protein CJO70_25955 [Burkholderia ubonensis]PAJ95263.1 hypothetical protein CJO69_06635 [Burkholderia ubonensis]PAJ97098.1 hypothetical protein CJO68_32935 [Burkholderia ubonensis]PAK09552.1 hypothetical protein CJO67_00220 [Burkholderia ubonensis]